MREGLNLRTNTANLADKLLVLLWLCRTFKIRCSYRHAACLALTESDTLDSDWLCLHSRQAILSRCFYDVQFWYTKPRARPISSPAHSHVYSYVCNCIKIRLSIILSMTVVYNALS